MFDSDKNEHLIYIKELKRLRIFTLCIILALIGSLYFINKKEKTHINYHNRYHYNR
jgi:hypothetical protein